MFACEYGIASGARLCSCLVDGIASDAGIMKHASFNSKVTSRGTNLALRHSLICGNQLSMGMEAVLDVT